MEIETNMSIGSKRELFKIVSTRYHKASKAQKSKILDEYSANCGINRKYAIRLLNEGFKRGKKKPGPVGKYFCFPEMGGNFIGFYNY